MEIIVDGLAKRFRTHWVFRGMSLSIPSGSGTAITGPNGSGKSTLLKVLSGALPASSGTVNYRLQGEAIRAVEVFRHVAFAAPYIDLIDEMTVRESVRFHSRFRSFKHNLNTAGALGILGGGFRETTAIHEMSSGMKQRMRLMLAICSETDILILDEPTTNLDAQGNAWFHDLLAEWVADETVLIASNDPSDMASCTRTIHLPDYSSSS